MTHKFNYVTTNPHPWKTSHTHGADQGQVGWKLHIVDLKAEPDYEGRFKFSKDKVMLNRGPALCGLRPRHGWGTDMFIDAVCSRCEKKAKEWGIPEDQIK